MNYMKNLVISLKIGSNFIKSIILKKMKLFCVFIITFSISYGYILLFSGILPHFQEKQPGFLPFSEMPIFTSFQALFTPI